MIQVDLPMWAGIPTIILLITSGILAIVGSSSLVRFKDFYSRLHPPVLVSTFSTICVLCASVLAFSAIGEHFATHEILIALFLVITLPISSISLMQAALYRDQQRKKIRRE